MAPLPSSRMAGHKLLKAKADLALDTCRESQAVEFSASQPWETLRWKITKTALAMGNLRDGGIIVIGLAQTDDRWVPDDALKDLPTYDVDKVTAQVNEYVSPHVDLTLVRHRWHRKTFVVISVHEFDQTPLVCKKGHTSEKLVEGSVYVRLPGIPQTTRITNAQQMHDLLELAADKRSRQFLERARRVGLLLPASSSPEFERELEGL